MLYYNIYPSRSVKFMRFVVLVLAAGLLSHGSAAALAAPKVMASIVPVHALVAGVMEGVGVPSLLLSGQNSEHQASYSPAQLSALADADVVFIIGGGLELKLEQLSGGEVVKGRRFIELSGADALTRRKIRDGGVWEPHEAHHDGDEHGHDADAGQAEPAPGVAAFDPHLWLDPANAQVMVATIAAALAKVDAANAKHYEANARKLTAELAVLVGEIDAVLTPVKNRPFVVFHDAFHYFEARFGLMGVGSISDFSANAPSAQRLKEVRDRIAAVDAVCVFREPQFSDAAVATVIEGTDTRSGVLDPIGYALTPGKGAYRDLLLALAQNLKSCLMAT
jgi:zinc transport system substrate-binding protein